MQKRNGTRGKASLHGLFRTAAGRQYRKQCRKQYYYTEAAGILQRPAPKGAQ